MYKHKQNRTARKGTRVKFEIPLISFIENDRFRPRGEQIRESRSKCRLERISRLAYSLWFLQPPKILIKIQLIIAVFVVIALPHGVVFICVLFSWRGRCTAKGRIEIIYARSVATFSVVPNVFVAKNCSARVYKIIIIIITIFCRGSYALLSEYRTRRTKYLLKK